MKIFECINGPEIVFIPNVPCKYQSMLSGSKTQFLLLHKLIENKVYRDYYLNHIKENPKDYIILDNSAFELSKGLNGKILMEWAKIVRANEVVIPDVYGDKDATLELAENFFKDEPTSYEMTKLMAVPQGSTKEELKECLETFCKDDRISVIGLNKLWERNGGYLQGVINVINKSGKEVHMLGSVGVSFDDWNLFEKLKGIRSADSRFLTKMVTKVDDIWDEELTEKQLFKLQEMVDEWISK